jgi:hypothetical protein
MSCVLAIGLITGYEALIETPEALDYSNPALNFDNRRDPRGMLTNEEATGYALDLNSLAAIELKVTIS